MVSLQDKPEPVVAGAVDAGAPNSEEPSTGAGWLAGTDITGAGVALRNKHLRINISIKQPKAPSVSSIS